MSVRAWSDAKVVFSLLSVLVCNASFAYYKKRFTVQLDFYDVDVRHFTCVESSQVLKVTHEFFILRKRNFDSSSAATPSCGLLAGQCRFLQCSWRVPPVLLHFFSSRRGRQGVLANRCALNDVHDWVEAVQLVLTVMSKAN